MLERREFVETLMPWLSSLSKELMNTVCEVKNLTWVGSMVECLLGLLGDESGSEKTKAEIEEVYQSISWFIH